MQVFIWLREDYVTWRVHHEAAVVIIAGNLMVARALFRMWQKEHRCHNEDCGVYHRPPNDTTPTIPRDGVVHVFADAGCC